MIKYFIVITIVISVLGCQGASVKRINKDIFGINEQLYDLTKEQIKAGHQLQKKNQSKKKENKDDLDKVYKEGYKNYLEQNYTKALLVFNRIVKEYPGSDFYKASLIKIQQIKKNRRKR